MGKPKMPSFKIECESTHNCSLIIKRLGKIKQDVELIYCRLVF